ncbi:hypothetical protein DL769_005584 [Monosporascus sp. CRB-8-3]|nr:hypothetical protein DL769_005584 [Monosporascus sp. CRB-8-3]
MASAQMGGGESSQPDLVGTLDLKLKEKEGWCAISASGRPYPRARSKIDPVVDLLEDSELWNWAEPWRH